MLSHVSVRLWLFWLNECHGSHGSHDNHGQSGRWRLHLFLLHILWGRWWRRNGQLPLRVHFYQDHQRQKDHYEKVDLKQQGCDSSETSALRVSWEVSFGCRFLSHSAATCMFVFIVCYPTHITGNVRSDKLSAQLWNECFCHWRRDGNILHCYCQAQKIQSVLRDMPTFFYFVIFLPPDFQTRRQIPFFGLCVQ